MTPHLLSLLSEAISRFIYAEGAVEGGARTSRSVQVADRLNLCDRLHPVKRCSPR